MQSGLEILSWSFWSPETREPSQWPAVPGAVAGHERRPGRAPFRRRIAAA